MSLLSPYWIYQRRLTRLTMISSFNDQTSYGIKGNALQWFRSYLHGRQQSVRRGSKSSKPVTVIWGVPQGSVLGPILFVLYTADIAALVQRSGLVPHLYADDTQVYGWSPPHLTADLLEKFSACFDNIYSWMRANRLQLNMDKTEFMWCTTTRRQHQLPAAEVTVGPHQVTPSKSVRDLGIFLDSDLVMRTHVLRTVSRCFAMLRQLRSIRRSVPTSTLQTLVVSLVLSRSWLWKRYTGWSSGPLATSDAISAQRLSSADPRSTAVWPHHRRSGLSALASSVWTN